MDNFDLKKYLTENKRTRINEGTSHDIEEYTLNIENYKGGIAYSLKDHDDRKYGVSGALGDKFGFWNKGGIIVQRSHGSDFDTVWLSTKDIKEVQEVSDWLKSQGAEVILFGSRTTSFKGSKLDYINRFL